MCLAFLRQWFDEDIVPRLCHITYGLLQLSPGLCIKDDHGSVVASTEYCSTLDIQHRQVWTWTVTAASRRLALVGHTQAGPVQAGSDHSSLAPEPSASIPRRSLCSRFQRRWSPSTAISYWSSTDCTMRLSQYLWHSYLYYYYYQCTDLSDAVTHTIQGHFTES